MPHKFCPDCGTSMVGAQEYDSGLICPATIGKPIQEQHIHWENPTPAGVILLPTYSRDEERGLWICERGPDVSHTGGWALISGFMLRGETWQEAIMREAHEELEVTFTKKASLQHIDVANSSPNPITFMSFSIVRKSEYQIPKIFTPNGEATRRGIFTLGSDSLCFATHQRIATRVLQDQKTYGCFWD